MTQKSRRGRYSFIVCLFVCSVVVDDKRERQKTWHVLTERAWVRGVGIDFLLQACCCRCYAIQPVHNVLHECVVGCPILSSMYEHVLIYHHGVVIDFLLQSCCSWCYAIQPVHHVLHECVVECPILSSMYEHVPIYHRGVGIDFP